MSPSRSWALHPGLKWAEALHAAYPQLRQSDAALLLGVSTKHLNRILRCNALPSAALTIRFSELVGVSAQLLWRMRCEYELDVALGAEDLTPEVDAP